MKLINKNVIKRVRLVRRADGYYCQFCVDTERKIEHVPSGKQLGIDVGLKLYLIKIVSRGTREPVSQPRKTLLDIEPLLLLPSKGK